MSKCVMSVERDSFLQLKPPSERAIFLRSAGNFLRNGLKNAVLSLPEDGSTKKRAHVRDPFPGNIPEKSPPQGDRASYFATITTFEL